MAITLVTNTNTGACPHAKCVHICAARKCEFYDIYKKNVDSTDWPVLLQ